MIFLVENFLGLKRLRCLPLFLLSCVISLQSQANLRCEDVLNPGRLHQGDHVKGFEKMWADHLRDLDVAVSEATKKRYSRDNFSSASARRFIETVGKTHAEIAKTLGLDVLQGASAPVETIIKNANASLRNLSMRLGVRSSGQLNFGFVAKRIKRVNGDPATDNRPLLIPLQTRGEVPEGYRLVSDFSSDYEYAWALSQGLMPVSGAGDAQKYAAGILTKFEHEIAHVTGVLEFPEWGFRLRPLASKMVRMSPDDFSKNLPLFRYLNEALILVRPEVRQDLSRRLGEDVSRFNSFDEILNLMKPWSAERLAQALQNLNALAESAVLIGGGARDPIGYLGIAKDNFIQDHIKRALVEISLQLKTTPEGTLDPATLAGFKHAVAQMFFLIKTASHIELADWIDVMEALDVRANAKVYALANPDLWTFRQKFYNQLLEYGDPPDFVLSIK